MSQKKPQRRQRKNTVISLFDDKYKKEIKFMWVNNVFMPDSWKNPIPDYETFIGNGIGKLGSTPLLSSTATVPNTKKS